LLCSFAASPDPGLQNKPGFYPLPVIIFILLKPNPLPRPAPPVQNFRRCSRLRLAAAGPPQDYWNKTQKKYIKQINNPGFSIFLEKYTNTMPEI